MSKTITDPESLRSIRMVLVEEVVEIDKEIERLRKIKESRLKFIDTINDRGVYIQKKQKSNVK